MRMWVPFWGFGGQQVGVWNPLGAELISSALLEERQEKARRGAGLFNCGVAYFTSTARLSAIFLFQIAGPVMCTDSPLVSTATVTGMSFTSNS